MDSLFMGTGIHGLSSSVIVTGGIDVRPCASQFPAVGRSPAPVNSVSVDKGCSSSSSKFSFNYPFRSFLFGGGNKQNLKGVALDDAVLMEKEENIVGNKDVSEGQNGNWVLKVLHVRSLWSSQKDAEEGIKEQEKEGQMGNCASSSSSSDEDVDECGEGCGGCDYDDVKNEVEFDRKSFSKMLKKVSLSETKLYAQLSYLGSLAYSIPNIKPRNLLKRYGLHYVTSSIEKREQLALAEKIMQVANTKDEQGSSETEIKEEDGQVKTKEHVDRHEDRPRIKANVAIEIAASAASFLYNQTRTILPLGSSKDEAGHNDKENAGGFNDQQIMNSEMASLVATTDSVTAVVAAKEEVKQAVADDLNSISSSPCEWYTCDDDKTETRYFVVQGSETLASWQANLLFEPVQFEGLDVFVHRGIYEAAKGMYQQMLPEIQDYMKSHGNHAKFRFTGHSLGGSLSLLINLMLLMRGEVPYSSLLPVVTYGSPCIMCGGDNLLNKLGLPKSHVQSIVMHRDIVPRAFSCNYPRPAAQLLKALNGNFRNHPCLNNQKLLYAPMGEMLILQPDAKYSPQHDLLPSGSGLFLLTCNGYDVEGTERLLRSAKSAFLNLPHPLEILSDRGAYGNGGTIQRDHDMDSYFKCLRSVTRKELSRRRKTERERRRNIWWPLIRTSVVERHVVVGTTLSQSNVGESSLNLSGMVRTGTESLKWLTSLVASQRMHLFVVLLSPARMLLIGAYNVISPSR